MNRRLTILCLMLLIAATPLLVGQNNQFALLDSARLRMTEAEQLWQAANTDAADSLHLQLAHCWREYAFTAEKTGRTEEAQQYAQRAYEVFMEHHDWSSASLCLYERYVAYNNIGDTTHMAELMEALQSLADKDTSALTQFNYYSILLANHSALGEGEQAIAAGLKSIYYLEQIQIHDYARYHIQPVWNYYNMALMYDFFRNPPRTDSIAYWLDRAEEWAQRFIYPIDRQESMISIGDERAWLYYYNKDYARAEAQMREVMALIDTVAVISPASIVTERGEAYTFMVELYEAQGRYAEALHYQQLLTDNNKERYDLERQRVLDDVQTQYEVKLQKAEITRQQSIIRLISIIALLALLAIGLALTAVLYRKRQTEEALYAKALEAENIYTELLQAREQTNVEPLEGMREQLLLQIQALPNRTAYKQDALRRVEQLNLQTFKHNIREADTLSVMDKRYLMCFAAGLTAEQVADIYCIEPASVYTVRYRIRKKFRDEKSFLW